MTTAPASSSTGAAHRRLGLRLGLGALAAAVVSAPFTLLTVLVFSESERLESADRRVADSLNAEVLPRPGLARTLEVLAVVTHPNVWRLIALAIAIVLWTRGRRRLVAWLAVTMTVGGLLGPGLKELVSRARPAFEEPVTTASGYSFPSGHALNSMLFAACLLVLAHPVTRGPRRALVWVTAAAIVAVTAVDRVALGVHFLSDVLAGWVVALATVAATTVSFAIWRRGVGLPAVSADTGLDPADDGRVPGATAPGTTTHDAGTHDAGTHDAGTHDARTGTGAGTVAGTGTEAGRADDAGTGTDPAGTEARSRWWGFLGRLAAALLARWVLVLVILVALGLLVTRIAEQVWPFTVEDDISRALESGRTAVGDDVSFWMSAGGNTSTIVPLCLLAFVALRVTLERWRESIFVASVTLGQSIVFVLTTMLIDRPRPEVEQMDESPPTSSFPSGHTSAAIAFYTALAIVAHRRIANPWTRRIVMAVLLCLPAAVAIGRLYRGMHHPSDVTASLINAGLLLLLTDRLLRTRPMPDDGAVPAHGVPRPGRSLSGEALASEDQPPGPHAAAAPAAAARPGRSTGRDAGSRQGAVALIVNPVKVDDVDALAGRLRERCAAAGLDDPVVLTTTAEDPGRGQAREALASGATLVLAAGGDGTVRAVAEGLAGSGVPLAVLPQGTGNLLARNLDLPLDLDDALDAAMHGEDRAIDVGRIDESVGDSEGTVFAVMAGVGFDAAMMQEAPEGLKSVVGWPAYIVGGARGMRRGHMRVEVSLDGAPPIRARARTVLVANLGKLQGGLELAPDASPDDGLLDVVLVSPSRAYHWVMLAVRGVSGRSRSDQRLRMFQASSVHIRVHRPQPRQVDGDLIADGVTLAARVEPGALVVRFPASEDASTPDAGDEVLSVAARS